MDHTFIQKIMIFNMIDKQSYRKYLERYLDCVNVMKSSLFLSMLEYETVMGEVGKFSDIHYNYTEELNFNSTKESLFHYDYLSEDEIINKIASVIKYITYSNMKFTEDSWKILTDVSKIRIGEYVKCPYFVIHSINPLRDNYEVLRSDYYSCRYVNGFSFSNYGGNQRNIHFIFNSMKNCFSSVNEFTKIICMADEDIYFRTESLECLFNSNDDIFKDIIANGLIMSPKTLNDLKFTTFNNGGKPLCRALRRDMIRDSQNEIILDGSFKPDAILISGYNDVLENVEDKKALLFADLLQVPIIQVVSARRRDLKGPFYEFVRVK